MRAFVIGGSGLVGRAVSRRLLRAGWNVDVVGRDRRHLPGDLAAAGVGFLAADRDDGPALRAAFGTGSNLLVDCVCYTGAQATALLPLAQQADSTVMISSKAVYVDAAGRHSNSDHPPQFGGPIRESQPTLPGTDVDHRTREGYGGNKVAAEQVLLDSGLPVSVLRPSKIHGEGSRPPREWVFVKRVLDRRPAVLFARRGENADHTTAAANIAALVETVAARPGRRILNIADPDAPSTLAIGRTVAGQLGHDWEEVLLEDGTGEGLGHYPWDRPFPVVLDLGAATELGYSPAGTYAATIGAELDWLVSGGYRDGEPQLPAGYDDERLAGSFDYAAEDEFLARRTAG